MAADAFVQRGEDAGLSVVRAATSEQDTAIQQLLNEDEDILANPQALQVSITASDVDGDHPKCGGVMLLTSERIVFWADQESNSFMDTIVPAVCIDLHAMAEDPKSVYLQIRPDSSNEEDSIEMTLFSKETDAIFGALGKLVSMHPVVSDDEDDDEDDEMVFARSQSPPPATDEEREAMLDYLDSVLVVPPHLENKPVPGQFDDAEDDDIL